MARRVSPAARVEGPFPALWHSNERLNRLRAQHLRYDYRGLLLCDGCEFTNYDLIARKEHQARRTEGS